MRNITITSALAALSLAALATPASAESMSVTVPYADLDLTTPAGMAALDSRIETAAKRICVPIPVRSALNSPTRASCVRQAIASTDVQVARIVAGGHGDLALNGNGQPRG